jgi:hypothetical protein
MERPSFMKKKQPCVAYTISSSSSSLLMIIIMIIMINFKGTELGLPQTSPYSVEGIGFSAALI